LSFCDLLKENDFFLFFLYKKGFMMVDPKLEDMTILLLPTDVIYA